MNSDEVTKIIKEKVCSGCGKHFEWEPYDRIGHDDEADVRIIGQCGNYPDCKDRDEMVEFIATEWEKM